MILLIIKDIHKSLNKSVQKALKNLKAVFALLQMSQL